MSLFNRVRLHAEKRGLDDATAGSVEWLGRAKKFVRLEWQVLLRKHRLGGAGLEMARWRATVLDVLLGALVRRALREVGEGEAGAVCVVALGGYGRGELCPFSDIDVLFLYDDGRTEGSDLVALQERVTRGVLYPLWDLHYTVGHSSRTLGEVALAMRGDAVSCNALLDARVVAGDEGLFARLEAVVWEVALGTDGARTAHARFLFEGQARRHAHFGGSVFVQEPDVKNGVGGLRDFHTLCWLARLMGIAGGVDGLARTGILRQGEAKVLKAAYSFLLRVRNALHFLSGRAVEVLSLEAQRAVASGLGFAAGDGGWTRGMELLMRDFYKAAEAVRFAGRSVEWAFLRRCAGGAQVASLADGAAGEEGVVFDGFVLRGGRLGAAGPDVFDVDPARLMRVFRHAQQFRATVDFALFRLVRERVELLTPRVAASRGVVDCFLAVLADAGRVGEAVALMHEAGVLGRFLPEFSGIHCLVQREIFHRYTVDVHTLLCLRELDAVFAGKTPVAERYRGVLLETDEPAMLYVVLLLHDIGKQSGVAGHAESGARMAEKILRRLGVRNAARREVVALIAGHLAMSEFWRRHDLDEPGNLRLFAEWAGSAQRLRYLYVLTFCDARATAPDLWNDYKEALHRRLFTGALACMDALEGAGGAAGGVRELRARVREVFEGSGVGRDEVEAHLRNVPRRYLQQSTVGEVCLHVRMVHQLLSTITSAHGAGALSPVIHWADGEVSGVCVVSVVSWDCEGLFYQLAGAFAVAGLNILSCKAFARSDHVAIASFCVMPAADGGRNGVSVDVREAFARNVDEALVQRCDLEGAVRRRAMAVASSVTVARERRWRAPVTPRVSVHREVALGRTVVEVETEDRAGLLFFLGRLFFRHRLDIVFARVATERGVAVDTFYLVPFGGEGGQVSRGELEALRVDVVALLD
ncbi:MAG: [protein-PII] uridylyltransferase [Puniceicoccales bacterium]|jgi:[protein-PII] uridylyltransferase|nr:[protein-PII] uridylyltransferase [Puniceicoccales bacterium]